MTQQIINVGGALGDGTGEPARTAYTKCNDNFTELYQVSRPTGNAIEYQFNNTTTEPPASGQIRFNQATQALTTKLWANHTTSSGVNIKQFLAAATTGAKLVVQDKIDNTNYVKFDVTGAPVDKTTYWEFTVAVTASGGNLPNAAVLAAVTAPSGTQVVVQKFTASGTYTPTGMKYCILECVGGGGGGGGSIGPGASASVAGGGGGSGGYSRTYATAAMIGASKAVTIGAAGAAGSGTGGTTSVGSLCIANGGGGGLFAQIAAQAPRGGAGGAAGTGDVTSAGAPGSGGHYNAINVSVLNAAGNGGSSIFGGGALGPINTQATGVNASAYGSGGSGACSHATATTFEGGAGSAGIVIITEFI